MFDTLGRTFDSVVYVLDGVSCEGTLRACDNDTLEPAGRVQLPFAEGQSAVIVVDGLLGDSVGDFVLNIAAAP